MKIFLDTCFIIYELQHNAQKFNGFCKTQKTLLLSFNVEELSNVKVETHLKQKIKKFLEQKNYELIEINVHPGEWDKQKEYIQNTDEQILKKIHDPSDAVLVCAAIKEHANILTRDKHHLFTEILKEEIQRYGLNIYNSIHEI